MSDITKHIIAIGGGGFGRNPNNRIIEKYILGLCNKEHPNILFIPTASAENQDYIINFYNCFNALECRPKHLNLFQRTPNLKSLISKQDIIFVGGGNTKSMLAVWKEWKLDKLIYKAYNNGAILSGVSAGAICWYEQGVTDSWASNLNVIDCLGFIDGCGCPHYDGERDRKPSVRSFINNNTIKSCIAIEDSAAVHYQDGKLKNALSFGDNKTAYEIYLDDNKKINENPIDTISLI